MMFKPKKYLLVASASLACLMAATGCGGGDTAEGTADDPVQLRFSWWGNDQRVQDTMKVIEAFEAENPGIEVQGEYSDFSGYWDKLATQVAGGDAPDIFAMSGSYPSEYASRGALLDLAEVEGEIDTSKFADGTVELGQIDGVQYTVTAGVNSMSLVLNPAVFEEAGVAIPDDETWTWDDYVAISEEISANSPAGTYGTSPMTNDSFLMVWARQHGESLYTEDGSEAAISEETLVDWFEMNQELMDNGGAPPAAASVEDIASSPEQTLMGQGKQGMKISWSNQMNAYTADELQMLKLPGESETAGSWLRSSMEYAISSRTEHPEETAKLLNYLVNSPEAAAIIKTDRGMQANLEVRETVLPLLDASDEGEATYLDRIGAMDIQPPAALPPGSSATLEVLERKLFEVLFGQTTSEDAAVAVIEEINANLANQ